MQITTDNTMMDAWKRQLDTAMRITEAIVEGSTRMHEVATQKALAAAGGPAELLRIQTEWMVANQRKSMEYWRNLYQAAADTNAQLMGCMRDAAPKSD
jgi:hypothetical protein